MRGINNLKLLLFLPGQMQRILSILCLLDLCLTGLQGCSPVASSVPHYESPSGNFVASRENSSDILSITSLFIMPVDFDENVRAQEKYGAIFYDALKNAFRAEVDMESKADDAQLRTKALGAGEKTCIERGKAIAAAAGADAIACTTLHRFVERKGSAVGAEVPAQINFTMQVVRLRDASPVWGGDFVFNDEALNQNLLALDQYVSDHRASPGWQSAAAVIERGFREATRDFAQKRLAKFAPGAF